METIWIPTKSKGNETNKARNVIEGEMLQMSGRAAFL